MRPNFFMGPTLYDSRLGLVSSRQQPCAAGESCFLIHTDMLHEAPLCMGIAHDAGSVWSAADGAEYRNVYWAYDGGHRQLVRFDFESDHGPGSMDHSRASVRRYSGLELTRVPGVPSHMSMDGSTRELFIADTGADRIVKVMADTGHYSRDAKQPSTDGTFEAYAIYSSPEAAFNYSVWDGLVYSTFAHVPMPSGLVHTATTIYAASHSSGYIYAFSRSTGILLQVLQASTSPNSLLGLALAPQSTFSGASTDGSLFFIDATSGIKRVDSSAASCPATTSSTTSSSS